MIGLDAEVERIFQEDYGRVLAGLIRVFGDFDLAEDALQDALVAAVDRWPVDGVPDNPAGWLMTAARRKALDRLRRDQTLAHKQQLVELELEHSMAEEGSDPTDWLRLIFTCCHPALNAQAPGADAAPRSGPERRPRSRARSSRPSPPLPNGWYAPSAKIKLAGHPLPGAARSMSCPSGSPAVLSVIYLTFNEGYAASSRRRTARNDLSAEAIRLGRQPLTS